jgi:hypothetical protein
MWWPPFKAKDVASFIESVEICPARPYYVYLRNRVPASARIEANKYVDA